MQQLPPDVNVLRRLPRTERAISVAHEQALASAGSAIAVGDPVKLVGSRPFKTHAKSPLAGPASQRLVARRHILSVGIDVREPDARAVPGLSRGEVLKFLRGRYVTLQAGIRQDPVSGHRYLHPRPMGGIALYRGSPLVQELTDGVAASLHNYRGLGLFLNPNTPVEPRHLRTLVILHRSFHQSSAAGKDNELEPRFEYVFVRAHDDPNAEAGLRLHTFATTQARSRLLQLPSCPDPRGLHECSLTSMIFFTEFTYAGFIPVANATRETIFRPTASFRLEQLDEYAQSQGWQGDAFDNLTATLDAIIDEKIAPNLARPARFP
jgi:hypothetical protein